MCRQKCPIFLIPLNFTYYNWVLSRYVHESQKKILMKCHKEQKISPISELITKNSVVSFIVH